MFNVILELISANCPIRNPEISEQKTRITRKKFHIFCSTEFDFLFIVVSFFLLNSQSAFLMLLDVESSALLGNAKDSEVCMYGFSIQFSCTILQFYCVSFNLLRRKNWKKSLWLLSFFLFLVSSILFAIWKILVVDACHGVSLLCCYILCCCHYFLVNKKNRKRNTDLIKALTERHQKKSIKWNIFNWNWKFVKSDSLVMKFFSKINFWSEVQSCV